MDKPKKEKIKMGDFDRALLKALKYMPLKKNGDPVIKKINKKK